MTNSNLTNVGANALLLRKCENRTQDIKIVVTVGTKIFFCSELDRSW